MWWGCAVPHGRFSSAPGLDTNSPPPAPAATTEDVSRHCQMCPRGSRPGRFCLTGAFLEGEVQRKHVEVRMEGRHVGQAGMGEPGDLDF